MSLRFGCSSAGQPTLNAAFGSYQGALVPDHLQGRVESIAGLIAAGVAPLGPLLAGFLLGWIGGTETVLVFWAISIAVVLVAALSRPLREMPDLAVLGRAGAADPSRSL